MKKLKVPFLANLDRDNLMQEVSERLDTLDKHLIAITPWPTYAYKPSVQFSVAYNHDCLFIKYFVQESSVRAVFRRSNEPVYRDSCVEFFISFNQEKAYYNLEFNSLGTCRFGFGTARDNRAFLPEAAISKIKRAASLNIVPVPGEKPEVKWELTLVIPARAFFYHDFRTIKDQDCRVNFYKCGDDLDKPHYVTWNPVEAAEPNFHLPEFFGEVQFI